MTIFLKDMDLFGNSLNGNTNYQPPLSTRQEDTFDIATEEESTIDLSVLDSSILPIGMVEVRVYT